MARLFPSDANHYLSLDALAADDVHFFSARRGDMVVGVGALAERGDYGEFKSMFVEEGSRGQGVIDAIMRQLEDHARGLGLLLSVRSRAWTMYLFSSSSMNSVSFMPSVGSSPNPAG